MSGIFGCWRLDGTPVEAAAMDAMSRRLEHRGPHGSTVWSSGPVALGHRMLRTTPEAERETQPLPAPGGEIVLVADLRLDNREELFAALDRSLRPTRPPNEIPADADLVLASYRAWGERCVERWIGDFAVAIWDGPNRRLLCARDPFGVKPLYYHYRDGRLFAFASEVEALFALPEVPDEIDDFEVARHLQVPLGGDASTTYYAHVRRVLPAHALTVSEKGLGFRRHWSVDPTRELELADDREYAEALRESFVEAVRCRLRSSTPVACMLSGGMDSASIACVAADLLQSAGKPPLHTFSAIYPAVPESDERRFIDDVLGGHRMTPHFFAADAVDPIADIDRMNRLIGGANWGGNLYLNWVLYGMAAEAGAGVVLDGFDGDTTLSHGTGYLSELAMAGRWLELGWTSVAFSRRRDRPVVSDLLGLIRLGIRHPTRGTVVGSLLRRYRPKGARAQAGDGPPARRFPLLNPDFAARFSERIVAATNPPTTEREFHLRKLN
ncbi:MAG TPA: asparagine synthase-related protein, partial [Gemmatimonadota bacterium]|nr:asparagine synthase-related protein [Gemmatimonadota bacterium]